MGVIKSILAKLAQWLGLTIQEEYTPKGNNLDYEQKSSGLSIVDNVSQCLTPMVCQGYKWQIYGETRRARELEKLATQFVQTQLIKSVQISLDTGDLIAVPIMTHNQIITQLIDSDNFNIIDCAGNTLYEIQFALDTYQSNYDKYVLLEDIKYDIETRNCIYNLYVAKNGTITKDLSQVSKWADYEQTWSIPNVDKMLIGRMKCPSVNPSNINNIKGVPLCFGAGQAIGELKKLYEQLSNEFTQGEKMIFADKRLFTKQKITNNGERI